MLGSMACLGEESVDLSFGKRHFRSFDLAIQIPENRKAMDPNPGKREYQNARANLESHHTRQCPAVYGLAERM